MRAIIIAAATLLAATAAQAQSTTAWVPTGVDVPGPVGYELVNGRVVTIPNDPRQRPITKIVEAFSDPINSGAEGGVDADADE